MSRTSKHLRQRILLSWSTGKDSAWALHVLRGDDRFEVCGLLTTVNSQHNRVAMHGVRASLLSAQAKSAGLPLLTVPLPHPCSNEIYERCVGKVLSDAKEHGVTGVAFGDLFLEDVRRYRERQVAALGLQAHFPLWGMETAGLAQEMVESGVRAILTCVDPKACPRSFAGRTFDAGLLRDLPTTVDACGENGEFHTFAYAGPALQESIIVDRGDVVERDGFVFADLLLRSIAP